MAEPISLATARAFLRVDDTSEDTVIGMLISAAREYVENESGRILVQRPIVSTFERFGRYIELPFRPVIEITGVTYTDAAGAEVPYTGGIYSLAREPARIYPALNGWFPTLGRNGEVAVEYVAGYNIGEEPPALIQAVLLLIGHWFANRETIVVGTIVTEVPFAVKAICNQFRPVLG